MAISNKLSWLAAPLVALLLLAATDAWLRTWNPTPLRLPEHFSAAYLEREAQRFKTEPNLVLVLGDSVLWGYGVPDRQTAVALLGARFRNVHIENLSFEGGSPVNSELLLRYLLTEGVRPRLVLFNINLAAFNTFQTYATPTPALEDLAEPELTKFDRSRLVLVHQNTGTFRTKVDRAVESHWLFYRLRLDLHQAAFRDVDAVSALNSIYEKWSGIASRRKSERNSDPERYLGIYDLAPITPANSSYEYTVRMLDDLQANHISLKAFLTPTNHALLHQYIDVPAYDHNLAKLQRLFARRGVPVLNLDRVFSARLFLDNVHLTSEGNRLLADRLAKTITPLLR